MFSPIAYIDPATGNALVYLIIGAFCGVAYFFKGLFYKLFRRTPKAKGQKTQTGNQNSATPAAIPMADTIPIALFSEGKNYWPTYEPIVNALIGERQVFCYYTMDRYDPALTIENEFMHSKYIGQGARAYNKLKRIEHPILLTTTPNIGAPGYPLDKPPYVQKLIHVFHSIADMSQYKKHSLDAYDIVYMAGEFQRKSIVELEQKRGLPAKELYLSGLPYLDTFAKEMVVAERQKQTSTEGEQSRNQSKEDTTVLIGSSWGAKGCLIHFGIDFVKQIAEAGYQVILRPHPQSYLSEPEQLRQFEKDLKKYSNIHWDNEVSPSKSMMASDIMVSDASSIRFDYAFLYKKPVISLEIPPGNMEEYEYVDLHENSLIPMNQRIGYSISDQNTSLLVSLIEKALDEFSNQDLDQIREETICNFRHSGEAIAGELIKEYHRLMGSTQATPTSVSREDFDKLQEQLTAIHEDLALIKKAILGNTQP